MKVREPRKGSVAILKASALKGSSTLDLRMSFTSGSSTSTPCSTVNVAKSPYFGTNQISKDRSTLQQLDINVFGSNKSRTGRTVEQDLWRTLMAVLYNLTGIVL